MIGIYKITNPNNKVYIGQSIDIKKRFRDYIGLKSKSQLLLHRSFLKYGVDIFEGDKFYTVDSNFEIQSTFGGEDEVDNAWSTKEKAEEYILLNKPCLSVNDIKNTFPRIFDGEKELIKLVKSKIQQSV